MNCSPRIQLLGFLLSGLAAQPFEAQQQPLTRHFVAGTGQRYQVTLEIKSELHNLVTETHGDKTYVAPRAVTTGLKLHWSELRKILLLLPDGSAQIEEHVLPAGPDCSDAVSPGSSNDPAMRQSLVDFCMQSSKESTIRYSESPRGLQTESSSPAVISLGESSPPLLVLWLRHALRASVILPDLPFTIGASRQHELRPSGQQMRDGQGSETIEWLDAQGDTPAATLHVVQQLSWTSRPDVAKSSETSLALRSEAFFADSLTTLSLLDGGVLRASRTASRTITHAVDPVPGLSNPPDFSSKLTLTVAIERIP